MQTKILQRGGRSSSSRPDTSSPRLQVTRVAIRGKSTALSIFAANDTPHNRSARRLDPDAKRTPQHLARTENTDALHRAAKRFKRPKVVIINRRILAEALPATLELFQPNLIVIEDLTLQRGRDGKYDCSAQIFGKRSRPNPIFLLLNPRDAQGSVVDEMECFDRWTGLDPRLLWSWAEDPVDRADAIQTALRFAESAGLRSRRELPRGALGADWLGVWETNNAATAIRAKTLFRHYGIRRPHFSTDLEEQLRQKLRSPYALALTSGSAALNCAIAALQLKPNDEVILPAFSWYSCYNAIMHFGLTPVFAEIDGSLNLDPSDLERRITNKTKAVIVVHYQGGSAAIGTIAKIARKHGIKLIEDCAQALGATYRGRPLGSIGDIGTYSFQANKIISSGEGGALVSRDRTLFERAVRYHDLGIFRPTFQSQTAGEDQLRPFPGNQYRISELSAAVALAQLRRLDWIFGHCQRHFRQIQDALRRECPGIEFRPTGDRDGDLGITLFIDWKDRRRCQTATAMLEKRGIRVGASSGMVNLLTLDYVQSRSHVHHPVTSGWPPHPPSVKQYPRTAEWLERYTPIAMSPRFIPEDVDRIVHAVGEAYHQDSL